MAGGRGSRLLVTLKDRLKPASYAKRYELLLRKMVLEKLYDAAAFLTANVTGGPRGAFKEPADDLTMRRFLAGLGGHVSTYLATR